MKAIQRVEIVVKKYGHTMSGLEKKVGLGNQTLVRTLERRSGIKDDVLNKILNVYPEISPLWILTGKGDMISKSSSIDEKTKSDLKRMELGIARIVLDVGETLEKVSEILKNQKQL